MFQLVLAEVRNKNDINIYGRSNLGIKYKFEIGGFEPYFYIPENDDIPNIDEIVRQGGEFESVFGDMRTKLVTRYPGDVKKIRDRFTHHYEADIPFARRFLIDKAILSGFYFPGVPFNPIQNPSNTEILWHKKIKPADFSLPPLFCVYDIEVAAPDRFPDPKDAEYPINCATVFDIYYNKYITFFHTISMKKQWLKHNHVLIPCVNEEDLIRKLQSYFRRVWPDILTGWNIYFDIEYTRNRAKKYRINFSFEGISFFDSLEGYKKLSNGSLGNRLKEVVLYEKIATKEEMIVDSYRNELWEDPNQHFDLIEYNYLDVKWVFDIINLYDIINFHWEDKNDCGLENIESTMFFNVSIDLDLLRSDDRVFDSRRNP